MQNLRLYTYGAIRIGLFLLSALFVGKISIAQLSPPAAYSSSSKINYVRTWVSSAPVQDPAILISKPLRDVRLTSSYFDGLGRPLQTVVKQGSIITDSSPVDLVSPVVYDNLDREEFRYLSFAANTTGNNSSVNDGKFKLNPFQQQAAFCAVQFPGEIYYYGQTQFEPSPLARVQKLMSPGNSWVGAGRGITTRFWANTITDDVKIWTVTDNTSGPGSYAVTGAYAAGTLFKNAIIDEAGHQVIEFKDRDGNLILKKVQIGADIDQGTGKGYDGYLSTYFIYDDLDNLRCVIQPKGVDLIRNAGWGLTDITILAEQCFRNEYDTLNRLVTRKLPGAGETYLVYDARDRQVFSQDGNMRSKNQWFATLYDAFNRPVITGLITYSGSRSQLQSIVTTQTGGSGSNDLPTIIEGVAVNRSALPPGCTVETHSVSYYDNYDWATGLNSNIKTFTTSDISSYLKPVSDLNYPYAQALIATPMAIGQITGMKIRILGSQPAQYLTAVNFYDNEKRLIQTRSQNITGGYDAVTTQYGWAGQILVTVQQQQKAGVNAQTHTLISQPTYDDLGRILSVSKTISSTIGSKVYNKPEQEILRLKYDALGQVKKKFVGNNLETIDFEYNILGWLLGQNRGYVKDSIQRFFGFELGYDKANTIINGTSYAFPQYNSNISGTIWKSAGDNEKRKFDYRYDTANRFASADFNQYTSSGFSKPNGLNFSVSDIAYDANGNILRMKQYGWKLNQPGALIDNLIYTYYDSTNKLKNVQDLGNDVNTKLGDFRSSQMYMAALGGTKTRNATDYTYDNNGNLKKDLNKDIGSATTDGIVYNFLNLPDTITVQKSSGLKGHISYVYDASGNKLKKNVAEVGQPVKTTLYLDEAVYQNDTLEFIGHEEGRLRFGKHYYINGDSALEFNHDYFLKDHLGNVRMVLTDQKDTARYIATLEPAFQAVEDALFNNVSSSAFPTPSYYPSDIAVTNPNAFVARLNGNSSIGKKIGPSIILKVMSGDKIKLFVKSFYQANSGNSNNLPTEEIVTALANSILGTVGPSKGSLSELTDINGPLTGGIGLFRSQKHSDVATKPKAYLNWVLFDEQFNYVSASSGASGVGSVNQLFPHLPDTVVMARNGYLYVYTSNETQNWDVFFNDLIITHLRSKIMEETHYYPFGLTIAGISTKAAKIKENKRKWNAGSELANNEFSDGSGLELYETFYRSLDPQLGRFWQVDPRPNYSESPYAAMGNNPVFNADPRGDSVVNKNDERRMERLKKQLDRKNERLAKSAEKQKRKKEKASADGNEDKARRIGKRLERINERIEENIHSKNRIDAMISDPTQWFSFKQLPPGSTLGESKLVSMMVRGKLTQVYLMEVVSDANAIHEIMHAYQGAFEQMMRYMANSKIPVIFRGNNHLEMLYKNALSEVEAYQAQFAFDPASLPPSTMARFPESMAEVSSWYVAGLNNTNAEGKSTPVYSNVKNWVNIMFKVFNFAGGATKK